ncbi:hypothetical protein G7Y89_g4353 [Cudoniella acicularis]|uniref:Uncharacterized protein n=1 Tax=Cudoniella acicularis TaxID=354080 RepID=A0A8H4W4D3_9HELO|nr:hypothetical protein G7Y89_g4353 [Cudoniella acicularis]
MRTGVLAKSHFSLNPISTRNPVMTQWLSSGLEDPTDYSSLPVFPSTRSESKRTAYRDTWTAGKNSQDESEEVFFRNLRRDMGRNGVAERFGIAAAEVCHQRKFFFTRNGFLASVLEH